MKKISVWAKHHVFAARCVIIISCLLLTIAGISTGILLNDLAVVIPSVIGNLVILLYVGGVAFYPFRSDKRKIGANRFYKKQKIADFVLALSTFLLIVFVSNHRFSNLRYFPALPTAAASSLPADSTVKTYKSIAAFSASMKDENGKTLKWKARKVLLKEQIRAIKRSNDKTKGEKVALIILSVLAALVLLSLVAMAACSLGCSGSEALAIIVGIGGTALVILLLVHLIRSITNKKKKAPAKEEQLKTG